MSHDAFLRQYLTMVLLCGALTSAFARPVAGQEEDAELQRQEQIVQRFLIVLEKNPRRGTAFDRIYGHHVEWGTLENFAQQLRDRVAKSPTDGPGWMILGLVESRRGRDAAAIDAFTQAEKVLPDSPLASYYLGQALVLTGQPDQAVPTLERGIERSPTPVDLLDMFQSLGRIHQRAGRNDQALAVWNRLEQLFPGDARVQEQIAVTLVEEGQFAAALPRFEKLIELTKDDYRRVMFQQEAAELKVRLGKGADALVDLESLLGKLNPDSWLYREVRRRIEDVFLRSDDQDGLARYYERWLANQPQDVDAMARLARVLARQARVPEARQWLERALQLAPSRRDLRLAFIDQLVDGRRIGEAIKQYEALDQTDPNNPDVLREWGKLILRDMDRPEVERPQAAERIWRRLVDARPKDALVATQVADLLRHANLNEQALELYRRAVGLAPDQPQYREYLGEFYHRLGRRDEALATWRPIAASAQRTADTLARLAEVLAGFGYLTEALPEISVACELDPQDMSLQIKAAELFAKAEKYPEALNRLAAAGKLAANPDEAETVLAEQLRIYQADGSLGDRTRELAGEVQATPEPSPQQLFLLARRHEAQRQYPEAVAAITRALQLDATSLPALSAAARIHEQSGDWTRAAELNRQLATLDRRLRTTYLSNVARLESQLGRLEEALQAGRDLIAAAPGNSDNHAFFAQLCFRLGRTDEGLETLRRAVRANPADAQLTTTLAQSLADQFRTDEALELYWQAFARSTELDAKLNCVTNLTDLYLQTNRFDKLHERLERLRREADSRREMTICIAQAFHSSGDFGQARQELETLLNEDTRDIQLLQQLAKLSEEEGDLQAAIKFQERVVKLAPGPEAEYRLANLLQRVGAAAESREILQRMALREDDPVKLLRSLDALLSSQDHETVLTVTESKLRESPKNWELLYRAGVALAATKADEAARRFQTIMDMQLGDDEPGVALVEQQKQTSTQHAPATIAASSVNPMNPGLSVGGKAGLMRYLVQIRQAAAIDGGNPYGGSYSFGPQSYSYIRGLIGLRQTQWTPATFGQARFAALAWLYKFADTAGQRDEFVAFRRQRAEAPNASAAAQWDWVLLLQLTNQRADLAQATKPLAQSGDPDAQTMYLSVLETRLPPNVFLGQRSPPATESSPPLTNEELDLARECYRQICSRKQANSPESSAQMAQLVAAHLRQAGRNEEARTLVEEAAQRLTGLQRTSFGLTVALDANDPAALTLALAEWMTAARQQAIKDNSKDNSKNNSAAPASGQRPIASSEVVSLLPQLVGKFGARRAHTDVLQILDTALDLDLIRRRRPSTNLTAARASALSRPRHQVSVMVWYGEQSETATAPYGNTYIDTSLAQLVRNVFHVFNRNENLPELFQHVEQRAAQAASGDKAQALYVLSMLHEWNDDLPRSLEQLAEASLAAPHDVGLRLESAERMIERRQFDEALSLLDAFTPQDRGALQQRESMVLDLAVRLGDTDRARIAAERLFGLRLSAQEQLDLSEMMRWLGQLEMADELMARAQRQAGNRTTALVALMGQYQSEGKSELAVQVATQILRRSRAGGSSIPSGIVRDDGTRQAALQLLQQTGRLQDLISRVEEQLKSSPGSTLILETLAEYYVAAGDRAKAAALQDKLFEQTPDTPLKRYQLAEQLYRSRQFAEACDQYTIALRRDPSLLQRPSTQIVQAYQLSNRTRELLEILKAVDLKALAPSTGIRDLIRRMIFMAPGRTDQAAVAGLFKRYCDAFPNEFPSLAASIRQPEFWSQPELGELLRQSLFPTPAILQRDPWHGLQANHFSPEGTISGMLAPLLRSAKDEVSLQKLRDDVAAAVQESPEWQGGKLLVPVLDARLGRLDEARSALESQLQDMSRIPGVPSRVVAQELEQHESLRDFCVRLYERSTRDPESPFEQQFRMSAGPRLVELFAKSGRSEDARNFLRRASPPNLEGDPFSADAEYAVIARMQSLEAIGDQFLKIDSPVDAARIFQSVSALMNSPQARSSRFVMSFDRQVQPSHAGLQRALTRLRSRPLRESLDELLPVAATDVQSPPVLELFISVSSSADGAYKMDSLLLDLFRDATVSQDDRLAVTKRVAEIVQRRPRQLDCRVLATILATSWSNADEARAAAEELLKAVDAVPLEPIATGQRPTTTQREDAERQLGLWFAAREFLGSDLSSFEGQTLAERALFAAERQTDSRYQLAMLYEWGALAVAAGDKPLAGEKWGRMLDVIVASSRVSRHLPAPPGKLATQEKSAPGAPSTAAVPNRTGSAPLTESQFAQFMKIAELSVDTVPELSAQAARAALAGGPPVPDQSPSMATASATAFIRAARVTGPTHGVDVNTKVITALANVVVKWQTAALSSELVYDTLQSVVFPTARPKVILLYESAIASGSPSAVQNMGALLIPAAIRANRTDDLEERIAQRRVNSSSELPALALMTQLAITSKNHAMAVAHLASIAELVASSPSPTNVNLACQVALLTLDDPELVVAATPILKHAPATVRLRLPAALRSRE